MHKLEMHEMSETFFTCWKSAFNHLNRQVDGGLQSWIRAHPYPPFLEHLSFRLGNQLFFVHIEDIDGDVKGPGSLSGLMLAAESSKGWACIMPMKRLNNENWETVYSGWGLIDVETKQTVEPISLVTDENIEMTAWEEHEFSVQVVRNYLEAEGFKITAFHSNPDVDPSIWFIGKSGELEWVVVRSTKYPSNKAKRPLNWESIKKEFAIMSGEIGHFASVALVSDSQPFATADELPVPLFRGHGMYVNFSGLE